MASKRPCPLCRDAQAKISVRALDARCYYLCSCCSLIYVDAAYLLDNSSEKAFYGTHENSIENSGYVRFLSQLLDPLLPHLHKGMHGLDYGCGPGPTLSKLIELHGIRCDDYDPFFFPTSLQALYDFVVSTETFEHFHKPGDEITTITGLLKPGALLGVMTERWVSLEQFEAWYYTKDPTHVCFYHNATFDYICRHFGYERLYQGGNRVLILRRSAQ